MVDNISLLIISERVSIHPKSCNFTINEYESPYLVYNEKMKSSKQDKVFIVDSTMIHPYPILLFGGAIGVEHDAEVVTVDEWIRFSAPGTFYKPFKINSSKVVLPC